MKKILLFLIFSLFLSSCNNQRQVSNVQASSYIVIEQSTNKILEGSNYDTQRSVASISKIMTAIVTIENIDINKIVKVPNEINKVYGSSIYLQINQEITIKDLLYGLLLRSGNDAAITLAISVSGSVDKFVGLMNEKADNLNLTNTYFSNPHGLDEQDNGNISSAYDMAMIYSYCMQNEIFKSIVSSKTYGTFVNKNKLIRTYEYCTGGKTGYTKKAKRTLVTSASKDDMNLIVVTLNCGGDFKSHQDIYEHYFNNYTSIKILNKGENSFDNISFTCKQDYFFLTNLNVVDLYYYVNYKDKYVEITLFDENYRVVDYIKVSVVI